MFKFQTSNPLLNNFIQDLMPYLLESYGYIMITINLLSTFFYNLYISMTIHHGPCFLSAWFQFLQKIRLLSVKDVNFTKFQSSFAGKETKIKTIKYKYHLQSIERVISKETFQNISHINLQHDLPVLSIYEQSNYISVNVFSGFKFCFAFTFFLLLSFTSTLVFGHLWNLVHFI